MEGLWKGGSHLKKLMTTQAEFTNLPRVGSDQNVAYPAFQLNIASAVEPSNTSEMFDSSIRFPLIVDTHASSCLQD